MSSPMGIPTLRRSGSKLASPASSLVSSFPSRGGYFRTHSQPEDQQAFLRSYSSNRRAQEPGVQEPLLQASWSQQKDAERGAEALPAPQKLTVWQELGRQCWLAGPMVLVNLLQYSITVVSVAFVGHLGELELASASIASSLAGVLGYYVLVKPSCINSPSLSVFQHFGFRVNPCGGFCSWAWGVRWRRSVDKHLAQDPSTITCWGCFCKERLWCFMEHAFRFRFCLSTWSMFFSGWARTLTYLRRRASMHFACCPACTLTRFCNLWLSFCRPKVWWSQW
jgi:hypothetical protein